MQVKGKKNLKIEKKSKSKKVTPTRGNRNLTVSSVEDAFKGSAVNKSSSLYTVLFLASAILTLCIFLIKGENLWTVFHNFFLGLFGITAFLWPALLFNISVLIALKKENLNLKKSVINGTMCIFSASTALCVFLNKRILDSNNFFNKLKILYDLGMQNKSAGLMSGILGVPLLKFLGPVGAQIITSLIVFVFLVLFFGTDVNKFIASSISFFKKMLLFIKNLIKTALKSVSPIKGTCFEPDFKAEAACCENESLAENKQSDDFCTKSEKKELNFNKNTNEEQEGFKVNVSKDGYEYPPATLLKCSFKEVGPGISNKDLKAKGEALIKILESFSVKAKIVNICKGPSVTRYELQPACGTKISKITNLADDIALNLAALDIRIEAPIPGKSAVGIEVPNKVINLVRMQELINSKEFIESKSKLTVVLGRDIAGNVKIADLSKMPHLLIAGSTGSGKSVCINSFIISLLYKSSPNEVKLIMVDPKVVELGIYNGIPHLMVPVVTDPRKASNVLNWAVIEMLKRYKLFAEHNVRDLASFNNMIKEKEKLGSLENKNLKTIPQVVIIIDELADLMMASPKEVEDSICRLAQMARAAGMHLVIATQRPSVNIITGVIKANIPSRIALAVSSQIDSRTILDSAGAEKLLGKGDMLFSPIGTLKPTRVQGCFVTDKEIQSVIDYIKEKNENNYDKKILEEMAKIDAEKEIEEERIKNRKNFRNKRDLD